MPKDERLVRIFEYALNQEQTGISFFEASLSRMGMGAAVSAFETLIGEEKKHIEFISSILRSLENEVEPDLSELKNVVMEPTNYFDERAKSEFLERCVTESMVPDVTVFNTAWLIERDLSEFYENMAERTEGAPREALQMLARWERTHEEFFRQFRDALADTYSKLPWGG